MVELDNIKAFVEFKGATASRGAHFRIYFGYQLGEDKKDNGGYITISPYDDSWNKIREEILIKKVTSVGDMDIYLTNLNMWHTNHALHYMALWMRANKIKGNIKMYK